MAMKDKPALAVETVPVGDLKPHPRNPRVHPESALARLAQSIETYGWTNPVLVDKDNRVLAGHARLKAAERLGLTEVPVIRLPLSGKKADAYLVADNRLAELTEWDLPILKDFLAEVGDGLTGFTDEELAALMKSLATPIVGLTDDDAVPEDAPTTCKPGELWLLGDHRLLCGDSTVITDVENLMRGDKAGLLLTDPPYAVEYVEKARDMNERGYGHSRATLSAAIKGDGLNDVTAAILWRDSFTTAVASALNENPAIYIWHAPGRAMLVLHAVLAELGFLYHQTLIWHKNNFVIGRCDYQWQHEPCYYGWIQGHRPPFYGPKNQTTVWDIARDTNKPVHPTQKPVAVLTPAIQNHLKSGEVAYDPFGGSGSTLIACEKLGRKCRMIEIDPHYCDVIIKRWEDFTGQTARRT